MSKTILPFSALALVLSLVPASAMCGGTGDGQQAQSTGQGGMMCGRPAQSTQAEDPFGTRQSKPQPQQQQLGMMCPCCRAMAGMGGMKMDSDDPHKGMDMSPKR